MSAHEKPPGFARGYLLLLSCASVSGEFISQTPHGFHAIYLLALATLMLALAFNGNFTVSGAMMAVFNAVVVSLTADGGYTALQRACQGEKTE